MLHKSYGDVYGRILLAANALRRPAATQTLPPVRREVVRISGRAMKRRSLGVLGGPVLAQNDWIVNEQILPAHTPQSRRWPKRTAILIACILPRRAAGFQVKKWAARGYGDKKRQNHGWARMARPFSSRSA